jgi:hypothetical protein
VACLSRVGAKWCGLVLAALSVIALAPSTPTATTKSVFTGWSGDCSGISTCALAMTGDHAATATFSAKCIGPKVVGKTLNKAKARIRKAHCRVGKITKKPSTLKKKGLVLKQTPKPGKRLKPNAKVNLVVGKGGLSAQAADGDLLRTISAANPEGCGTNIGVAFNGANLLVSCAGNNVIDVVRPSDGSLVSTITATSESSLGALAFDATRGKVWACSPAFGNGIVLIDPATGASSNAITPTAGGCQDGLAYDGSDDTLFHSADVSCTVGHTKTDGTAIASFNVCSPPLLGGTGNSGIAVGGDKLYMSNDGGQQIYRVEKNFSASSLFATLTQRLEDMECDNITFAPKTAIWVIDAFDRTLNAFEIPAGSCNFGGLPAGLTLTPATAENPVGTSHTVTATLDNPGGSNAGKTILFTVTGANPTTGSGVTDAAGKATFTYTGTNAGDDTITACFDRDDSGACDAGEPTATATKRWIVVNKNPDCSTVTPDVKLLWPPNHKFRLITLGGATDPDGDAVTLTVTGVTQDEALNGLGDGDTSPDAKTGTASNNVFARAERSGTGDGRVYRIAFQGSDGNGGTCTGSVTVGVPHDQGKGKTPVDSGQTVNSFGP